MVRRDRNHPSVFMYSAGNEVPDQRYADGAKTLRMLMNWVKDEDDPRQLPRIARDSQPVTKS